MFFWGMCFGVLIGYISGYSDGKVGEPPPPLKGTYESQDNDDRVEEYPDEWQ